MILDEPDEDADIQDDESLFDTLLGSESQEPETAESESGTRGISRVKDWPRPDQGFLGSAHDFETLEWFRSNHVDWRLAMGAVLRAWVAVKSKKVSALQPED